MPSNKTRLGKMIGGEAATPADPIQKGTPFQVSTVVAPAEPDLPAQIGALSAPLQEIARRYVGARRRSGEALLEAARWLTEARDTAEHGEWQVFLDATATSADTAERLLNIHRSAMQNPQFADSIARNWLGQSVAALLARPSTPPDVVAEMLGQAAAPSVEEVRGAIARRRDSRSSRREGQNPLFAGFGDSAEGQKTAQPQLVSEAQELIRRDTSSLDSLRQAVHLLTRVVETSSLETGTEVQMLLSTAEQALAHIRQRLAERHG